jgi:hypothetical protein
LPISGQYELECVDGEIGELMLMDATSCGGGIPRMRASRWHDQNETTHSKWPVSSLNHTPPTDGSAVKPVATSMRRSQKSIGEEPEGFLASCVLPPALSAPVLMTAMEKVQVARVSGKSPGRSGTRFVLCQGLMKARKWGTRYFNTEEGGYRYRFRSGSFDDDVDALLESFQ